MIEFNTGLYQLNPLTSNVMQQNRKSPRRTLDHQRQPIQQDRSTLRVLVQSLYNAPHTHTHTPTPHTHTKGFTESLKITLIPNVHTYLSSCDR